MLSHFDSVKHVIDWSAFAAFIVALMDKMPHVASVVTTFLTMIWFAIRIYESKTVQKWLGKQV